MKLLGSILSLLCLSKAFLPRQIVPHGCRSRGLNVLFDDFIDISDGKAAVLKRIMRRGDPRVGLPQRGDSVDIKWELRFLNGSVIGSSALYERENQELFRVRLGAEQREIILGWEIALLTMLEGEIANVYLTAPYAFGAKGLVDLVGPDTDIECILELCAVLPALSRRFETVGVNESISEELVEKIQ
jgi:hypothetical protein